MKQTKLMLIGVLISALLSVTMPMPVRAEMIGTTQLLSADVRADDLGKVQAFMTRDVVKQQLEGWGVNPQQATERLASLTDAEIQQLAQAIDRQPAGGDSLVTAVAIVFIVLIILELLKVIDVFKTI